jgi:hypothetical protein
MILSEYQIKFGFELLDEYCNKYELSRKQALKILNGVKDVRSFYDWVNADEFINQYMNKVT